MMRWLLNYTTAATIVRLVTANAVNFIITTALLERSGAHRDVRMLLPTWVFIALVSQLTLFHNDLHS